MAKRSFYRTLSIKPIYQTDMHTWDFITCYWLHGRAKRCDLGKEVDDEEIDRVRQQFIDTGCSICAYAMYMGITPMEAIAKDSGIRQVSIATGKVSFNLENWTWPGLQKIQNLRYYPAELASRILLDKKSAVIRFPGHSVTASGFQGTLSISPEGLPYVTEAKPNMILVNDPYKGRCRTLEDLFGHYGNSYYIIV